MFVVAGCESEINAAGGSGGEDSDGGEGGLGLGGDGGIGNQGGDGGVGNQDGDGGVGNQGGAGGGDPLPQGCELHNDIVLSDVVLIAEDNGWQPGETATFFVTMTTPVDDFDYPGISVSASSALVTPNPATNTLFGIFAAEHATIEVGLTADASLPPGTVITLTATVVAIDGSCGPDAPTITFDVTLE